MINRLLNKSYPKLISSVTKLNSAVNNSAVYLLNKYYKEHALKVKGEFYHG